MGCLAKNKNPFFLNGWAAWQKIKNLFPYGRGAGRRGANTVLEEILIIKLQKFTGRRFNNIENKIYFNSIISIFLYLAFFL
jgi:hypothetical protein